MIKVEAIEKFDLGRFDELQNIQRVGKDVKGTIFTGDTFECKQDLVEYLTGNNPLGKAVVKVIEVVPEKKEVIDSDGHTEDDFKDVSVEAPKKEVTSNNKKNKKSKK